METIRYDMITAHFAGIKLHPQREVERLGMRVIDFEGFLIGDCAFMLVDRIPANLPDYIQVSERYKLPLPKNIK